MSKQNNQINVQFSKDKVKIVIHLEKCSTSLSIKENQHWDLISSKSEWLPLRKQTTTNIGEDAWKNKLSVAEKVSKSRLYGNYHWTFSFCFFFFKTFYLFFVSFTICISLSLCIHYLPLQPHHLIHKMK